MEMQNFAPIMFASLVLTMLIGFPVAFSLSFLGLACGFLAISLDWFPASFMANLPLNIFGILSNDLLLALFVNVGAAIKTAKFVVQDAREDDVNHGCAGL